MSTNSNLEVLDFRKIKSLNFLYEINENGTIVRNVKSKRRTKIRTDKDGYRFCMFCIGGRKGKTVRRAVASMVAQCWLGDRPAGMQIDHKDRNRVNNDYRNLRYVTLSEQMKNRTLSQKTIDRARRNCLKYTMDHVAKPVTIRKSGMTISFQSMCLCADFMGAYYAIKPEQVRHKLKHRRSHIFDFDVSYTAETGHGNPLGKEQSA